MTRVALPLLLSCSVLACTKSTPDPTAEAKPGAGEPTQQPEPAQVDPSEADSGTNEATAEPSTQPEASAEPKPEPASELAEADVPEPAPSEPGIVLVTTPAPTRVPGSWRQAASPGESLTFVNLSGGVLASAASGYYDLDDAGQLVLRTEIEAPPTNVELIGVWPSDVWYIEQRFKDGYEDDRGGSISELRLMRLRSGHRWVPQEYQGEQRFADLGFDFVKGAKGGLLVEHPEDGSITRVAGASADPELGEYKGTLVAFVETRSGRLYPITKDFGASPAVAYVQRDCADQACVEQNAMQLPLGAEWKFSRQVPRQRHSVSLIAEVEHEGASKQHLLHYETGGWKLESLASAPTGIWATKDGGLWVQLGAELWHRDPDASWRNVSLPEGAGAISVAIREDQSELWIATMVADKPMVFATHANAQEPPPAAPQVAPQAG